VALEGHSGSVTSSAFDDTGNQVITASTDGTVRMWDATSGELLRLLQGPAEVSGFRGVAALRPDGRQVAATFSEKSAHLWELPDAIGPLDLPQCGGRITSVAASRDDRLLATAFDRTVCIFDIAKNERLRELETWAPVTSLAFGRESSSLAVASGNAAQIWKISKREGRAPPSANMLRALWGHSSLVLSVAFDNTGERIITASQDGTARIWNAQSGKSEYVLKGHQAAVFSAAFSSDGSRAVTGSFDGTVRIWNAATGTQMLAPIGTAHGRQAPRPVLAVTFTGDDQYVAATLLDRLSPFRATIAVWNVESGEVEERLDGRSLNFANRFVVYSREAGMRLPEGFTILSQNRDAIRNVVGSASSEALYTLSADGAVRVWPLPPTEPYKLIDYAKRTTDRLPEDLRQLSEPEREKLGLSARRGMTITRFPRWTSR
jgi:WD40 repeat protein